MKTSKQNSILMGVTAFCVVASLILCGFVLRFNRIIAAAQEVQISAREMQRAQIQRQLLFGELQEYSKTHPDLLRVLQPAGAPAKPAAK